MHPTSSPGSGTSNANCEERRVTAQPDMRKADCPSVCGYHFIPGRKK